MELIIIFLLAQYGLTNAISKEYIFEGLRTKLSKYKLLSKLISCETCLGFWVGCLLSFIVFPIVGYSLISIISAGLVASAFNKILLIILYKF